MFDRKAVAWYNRCMPGMSNSQFAKATGYHHTMVSRIRNGHRLPSGGMLALMCIKLDLDHKKYLEAYREGSDVFSALLRAEVFGPKPGDEVEDDDEFEDLNPNEQELAPCETASSVSLPRPGSSTPTPTGGFAEATQRQHTSESVTPVANGP